MRAIACVSCLVAGCFYIDPIQVHPTMSLSPEEGQTHVVRGGKLKVRAELDHPGTFAWTALACNVPREAHCSAVALAASDDPSTATLEVPVWLDDAHTKLTRSIEVSVVAHDDRGALVLGDTVITYPVEDAPPTLELGASPASRYAVDAPIQLYARYSDPDDDVSTIELTWAVVGQDPATPLSDLPASGGGANYTTGVELVPRVVGLWTVQATATDPTGAQATATLTFTIEPDHPPCIVQSQPLVPPAGATLPITAQTLFQIQHVDDDLDSYPPISSDPRFETTAFAWSIGVAGAARQPLAGVTGNAFPLDPASYAPGAIVELRVEAFDRKLTAITCPDAEPTCAITAPDSCIQRQTWRVEIR